MSTGDASLACAAALVDALVDAGLRHVVVSPGARSTPLVLAAARNGTLRVHVVLDERSAAFVALGIAKSSGTAAALVCTSGTAAANYLPAIVEASLGATPMIALTADRPPALRGTGANQTIEQRGLYGGYTRFESELPAASVENAPSWRAVAATAWGRAHSPAPGPVHLNVPFDEPLVPDGEPLDIPPATAAQDRAVEEAFDPALTERAASMVSSAERGVVLAGGLSGVPGDDVRALAGRLGWPLIAEPGSGLRTPGLAVDAGGLLLADAGFVDAHTPDAVLQIGDTPTGRPALRLLASASTRVVIDPARRITRPDRVSGVVLQCDAADAARTLAAATPDRRGSVWEKTWREAGAAARRAVDALLDSWNEPFAGRIARDLAAAIPDGATLCAGSSLPIRMLDQFMAPRDALRVIANRGASGIDGFVSTAFGVAATGAPAFALLGDLTLLHDAGGLLWNAPRMPPVTFVVPNDDGGGIFSLLPQATLPEHEALFATPHGTDLRALAEAARCGFRRVTSAAALAGALDSDRTTIVEVPLDRNATVARLREVAATVKSALA